MEEIIAKSDKINVLDMATYNSIVDYINCYKGLPIDCQLDLKENFSNVDSNTLKSILSTECTQKMKIAHHKLTENSAELLLNFEHISKKKPHDFEILIKMALDYQVSPTFISRLVIQEKYKNTNKTKIIRMIKNPHLIPDVCLAENAKICMYSDNQEGPISDFVRRCLGEEYEIKCKQMATKIGMVYVDEENLRRIGFDKTPDLKLALPCSYKGFIINWIESKALFGDIKTHKRYLHQQLSSYVNRFGSGIVIYWFGFVEDILFLRENGQNLMILNNFPESNHLEFLKFC